VHLIINLLNADFKFAKTLFIDKVFDVMDLNGDELAY
jgi:hypothetical protein